jgi:HSP20 family protein
MAGLIRREPRHAESVDLFDRFDRMFDEWMHEFPLRWPLLATRWTGIGTIPVDEYQDDGTLVVRAELPGIDPATDVELTVSGNTLRIEAERKQEEKVSEKGYMRREVRYGTFSRTLPLPEGVTEADITADYKDGILEIRIPTPAAEPAKKIPVTKR